MGYYQCIRCGGGEAYTSQENGRTFALTLDTPSPVDPTMFHTFKQSTSRCRNCGEKSKYVVDEYDIRSSAKFQIILGWVAGSFLLVSGSVTFFLYGFTSSFSDFAVLIGIPVAAVNILMGRARLKKLDSETP
jgi:hypothetical protein